MVAMRGLDQFPLICSDIGRIIKFYTEVVGMMLNKVVVNRDGPSSTNMFLDMGGGKFLVVLCFLKNSSLKTQRGALELVSVGARV